MYTYQPACMSLSTLTPKCALVITTMIDTRPQDAFVTPLLAKCVASQTVLPHVVVVVVPTGAAAGDVQSKVDAAFQCVRVLGVDVDTVRCAAGSTAGGSRNAGVEHVVQQHSQHVQCILFIDGDDVICPVYIERVVSRLKLPLRLDVPCAYLHCVEENDGGLQQCIHACKPRVYHAQSWLTSNRTYEGVVDVDGTVHNVRWDPCVSSACLSVGYVCFGHLSCTMCVFTKLNLRYNTLMKAGEDWDFVKQLGRHGVVIASGDILSAYLRWTQVTDSEHLKQSVLQYVHSLSRELTGQYSILA